MDEKDFLKTYRLEELYKASRLEWSKLTAIDAHHRSNTHALESVAESVHKRLRQAPGVHTVRYRIKDPEHLIAKIIRKTAANPDNPITLDNYQTRISDLVGTRAIHLFKDDWQPIHDFILESWSTARPPELKIRAGDAGKHIEHFENKKFPIEVHSQGYRSIHYIILTRPLKEETRVEIQMRTIFEEGWSEIDHLVRYPYNMDNPLLGEFLSVFNKMAGGADDMGTFTKNLSEWISRKSQELSKAEQSIALLIDKLHKSTEELDAGSTERNSLVEQMKALEQQLTTLTQPALAVLGGLGGIAASSYLPSNPYLFSDPRELPAWMRPYQRDMGFLFPEESGGSTDLMNQSSDDEEDL